MDKNANNAIRIPADKEGISAAVNAALNDKRVFSNELDGIDISSYLTTGDEPESKTLLSFNGYPVFSESSISSIVATAKSYKTTTATLLVAYLLGYSGTVAFKAESENKVVFFDTEQKASRSAKTLKRIQRLCGFDDETMRERCPVINLTTAPSIEIKRYIIEEAVRHYKPTVIVVDVVSDLVTNVNDLKECTELLLSLNTLVNAHKICAICTIHANENREQTDEFGNLAARGHMKELARKVETSLHLRVNQDYATLTFGKCRDEIGKAVFNVGYADGEPYIELSTETADEYAKERAKYLPIVKEIPLTGLSYEDMRRLIMKHRNIKADAAKKDLNAMKHSGLVTVKDKVYYDTNRQPK
jgi:AAA domain